MAISPRNALTDDPQARFFLAPETPQQRQYEALRAYFVEKAPSHEVAHRFGYTPGAFRVLCHQFRHDPAKRAGFFPPLPFTGVVAVPVLSSGFAKITYGR